MLSLERLHTNLPYQVIPSEDKNNNFSCTNMVGSKITGNNNKQRSQKLQSQSGNFLDNDTLLVILNSVLKTQQKSVAKVKTLQSRSQSDHQSQLYQSQLNSTTPSSGSKLPPLSKESLTQSESHLVEVQVTSITPLLPSHSQSWQRLDGIDCKIAQAMDSVKMELLCTVRKEVKELKLQVAQLQTHNLILEQENKILRDAAAPEVLAKLGCQGSTMTYSNDSCTSFRN